MVTSNDVRDPAGGSGLELPKSPTGIDVPMMIWVTSLSYAAGLPRRCVSVCIRPRCGRSS